MDRTITKDNKIIPHDTKYEKPSLEKVEKREEERLKNKNEEGKPKEGGSAGRAQVNISHVTDLNPKPPNYKMKYELFSNKVTETLDLNNCNKLEF
ncbi:hypothetical protein RIR_jg25619.t1 [Rhizophagus irregularis DAOM 181602=DAOM 197198]|nr:hypothetical protein RIR_jg25619.t1 [Rhizophagus irregularis DAOM 181602=DAOM 197198]